jgi:integrase
VTAKKTTGVYAYQTAEGKTLWRIKVERDGKTVNRRGFATKKEAEGARATVLTELDGGSYVAPSKLKLADYLSQWLDGLQLKPSTVASYRKNVRLHITPHLGTVQLANLTSVHLTKLYRELEKTGRQDGQGQGLSARTVRYIHTIISAALRDAVEADMIKANPAARAKPPTAEAARPPEMTPWDQAQRDEFLAWSAQHSELHAAWTVLLHTGLRRGELLALRWSDVDLAKAALTVRHSTTLVRTKGEGASMVTGTPKSSKSRAVPLNGPALAALKAHRVARGALSLTLAQPGELVFGDDWGEVRQGEHFSRKFTSEVRRARKAAVEVPAIRLHDTRHTFATLLLTKGAPVHVVSRLLGHASPVVTLTVYAHYLAADGHDAVALLEAAQAQA